MWAHPGCIGTLLPCPIWWQTLKPLTWESRRSCPRQERPRGHLELEGARGLEGVEGRAEGARWAGDPVVDLGPRAVLVKGGHLEGPAVDVLALDGSLHDLHAERVVTGAGHGTGCSLASAIAARLAQGEEPLHAVIQAKEWVRRALLTAPPRGAGVWPLNHFAPVPPRTEDH